MPATTLTAVPPKRARGRSRVEAVLAAASTLFLEKGYDATTMTEIAASSGTAIGSLYRFFPTKGLIADHLVDHYRDRLNAALSDLAGRAGTLTASGLADALCDLMLMLLRERTIAFAVVDAGGIAYARRPEHRAATRACVARILSAVGAPSGRGAPEVGAAVLLQLLKIFANLAQENNGQSEGVQNEARFVVKLYLADLLRADGEI